MPRWVGAVGWLNPRATHRVGKKLWTYGELLGDDYVDGVDALCTSSRYVHCTRALSAAGAEFN
jgi:hypothetical protein